MSITEGVPYGLFDCFMQREGIFPVRSAPRDVEWFDRSRLGMFVHWNHSSVAAREISWCMHPDWQPMPPVEYEALARRFNPTSFNADEWVALAREVGMGYLLMVVKHHDGFAMWDTQTSDYKITRTPFGRDVCAEIADACHKAGMRLGWYYSPADWWHPASRAARWDEYVPCMQTHLRELLTRYGTVDMLAFDFWSPAVLHPSWDGFYRELRRLCPRLIFSRNTPWADGDYEVFEHSVPYVRRPGSTESTGIEASNGYVSRMTCSAPFEVLRTLQCQGWSYRDGSARPLADVVRLLVDAAGSGGNLTLNVTPDASGRIPSAQVERLGELGAWMRMYGETVNGTVNGPLPPLLKLKSDPTKGATETPAMLGGAGRRPHGATASVTTTCVGRRVYVHVLDWMGAAELALPGLAGHVVTCRLVGGVAVRIAAAAVPRADPDTVIALELDIMATDLSIAEPPQLARRP
ncbi:alpha-L-fucosidase [Verrucomicrobiota bacterium]